MSERQEARLRKIRGGQIAQELHNTLIDRVLEDEDRILTELITKLDAGSLSETGAREGIARIAQMRKLMKRVTDDIKLGQQASEEEFGGESSKAAATG
jgi:predicted transcriptional regulator